jgi:hypothetical protein
LHYQISLLQQELASERTMKKEADAEIDRLERENRGLREKMLAL